MEEEKQRIRHEVLRESIRLQSGQHQSDQLVHWLTDAGTRPLVYRSCVDLLAEDPQRRLGVGQLLRCSVTSFPPSRAVLESLAALCTKQMAHPTCEVVYKELEVIVRSYLSHQPLVFLRRPTIAAAKFPTLAVGTAEASANPDYLNKFALQTPVENTEKGRSIIPISSFMERETVSVAALKNDLSGHHPIPLPGVCKAIEAKDYIYQQPVECTQEAMEQSMGVLANFRDRYSSNPAILKSSSFLIKLMCDEYVSKVSFGRPYLLVRSVSACFLPTLLEWMQSDYLCVRNHVYDFLLTLGLHLQLVDTAGVYPGFTEALQAELIWLLMQVLKRQSLTQPYDAITWTAAMKCTIALTPPQLRHLIDSRALYQFLQVPPLAEYHPELYGGFAENFAHSLLADKRVEVPAHANLTLDVEAWSTLNSSTAVSDILACYRTCVTPGGRLALFQVLFAVALHRNAVGGEEETGPPPESVQHCFRALVSMDLFWYVHPLLYYESHRVVRDLAAQIIYDLEFSELLQFRSLIVKLVQSIIHMVDEDATIPGESVLQSFMDADKMEGQEMESSMRAAAEEAITVLPLLLKEGGDRRQYNQAWRVALYALRRSADSLRPSEFLSVLDHLCRALISPSTTKDARELSRLARVFPDLLSSLGVLARTQPSHAVEAFGFLLEAFLFTRERPLQPTELMTLYYHLLELTSIRRSPICHAPRTADPSFLVMGDGTTVSYSAAASIGSRVWWTLYRGLMGVQCLAVCRARQVLVSILTALEPSEAVQQPGSIATWRTVLADPYPPVALVAATNILQRVGEAAEPLGTAETCAYLKAVQRVEGTKAPARLQRSKSKHI